MVTETPATRAHQRLGTSADDDTDDETTLSRWLPDAEPGAKRWWAVVRADPGRTGAMGLAAVGIVAVLITVFAMFSDDRPPVAAAKLPPVQPVTSTAPVPTKVSDEVVVSVVGLVHKPGLVTLPGGGRIADALTAAGGALDGADLVGLNLARRLGDGEQILVGVNAPLGVHSPAASGVGPSLPAAPTGGAKPGPPGVVDLNSATVEQLDGLPGVGPVRAAAIVAWRTQNGPFTAVEQLGEVDGIGPVRLKKLRNLVRV